MTTENEPGKSLLQQARDRKGWGQRELADMLNVGVSTLRAWEKGNHLPPAKMRRELCDLFEMTPEELGLMPNRTKRTSAQTISNPNLDGNGASIPYDVSEITKQDPNRQRMLKRVRTYWISGVLDHCLLDQGPFIHLHLREQPDAIVNPWGEVMQQTNLPPRQLPGETRIRDVYDEADGALLILGEPGAGKTTLLLDLARDLIEEASSDNLHPMPVLFNLSSWAEKRATLAQWLVDELWVKYQVPRSLAHSWVDAHQILPLLDGLDEVALAYRTQCVQALNAYRKAHGFSPMVVCARTPEYQALGQRLALGKAITIEPLCWEEIASYLSKVGKGLRGVELALQSDPGLQEMVSAPLMLHIVAQTVSVASLDEILSVQDPEVRRRLIFEKYVDVVLERRGSVNQYRPERTIRWLSFLAKNMQEHSQTEFYLERLQPTWLPDDRAKKYHLTVYRVLFGLSTLVSAGLMALFRGDSFPDQPGLFYWLGGGNGSSALGWMQDGIGSLIKGSFSLLLIFALVSILISTLAETRAFIPSSKALRHAIWNGLRYGSVLGIGGGLFALAAFSPLGWGIALSRGITLAIFVGFSIILLAGLGTSLKFPRLQRAKPSQTTFLDRCMDFLIFSGCGAIGFLPLYALQAGVLLNKTVLANTSVLSLFDGLLFAIGHGTAWVQIDPEIRPSETAAWSWQNVDLAGDIKKGTVLGVIILVAVSVALTCISAFFHGMSYGLPYGVVFGSITGFITGITSILTAILIRGWESFMISDKNVFSRPNEGIRRSMRNAFFAACVFGPVGGIVSGLMSGVAFGLAGVPGWFILGTGFSIIFSILLALHFFLSYGGKAVLSHYILRWYLWQANALPLNSVKFLDYATERILLRKVGGGYIFAHRLLLEYFASLE